jgi:N-acetylglucosamine malate deacetylase 1
MVMRTILGAFAHPDDEMGCVGTLAAHRAAGDRVVLLFLTRGEMTESLGALTAEQIARTRAAHAAQVADMLGAELRFLDFADTRIERTADAVHRIAAEISAVAPDGVITWGEAWTRGMRHPDHQATGEIVRGAVTVARIARAVAPRPPHRRPAPVFTLRDDHATLPELAVDVTPHLDTIRSVRAFYYERVGWPEEAWWEDRLARAGAPWGVAAAERFDAWETPGGLRTCLF